MRGWRGVFAGVLSLVALQTVVSSDASAKRAGSAFTGVASLIQRALSPAVALVPDLRPASGGSTSPAAYQAGLTSTRATTPKQPTQSDSGQTVYV